MFLMNMKATKAFFYIDTFTANAIFDSSFFANFEISFHFAVWLRQCKYKVLKKESDSLLLKYRLVCFLKYKHLKWFLFK